MNDDRNLKSIALIVVAFITLFLSSCGSSSNGNIRAEATPKPSPPPTMSDEERNQKRKETDQEQAKALKDFVDTHYKGFAIQGIASDLMSNMCSENEPCDVHITKGKDSRVISVMIKQFQKLDGSSYWYVFETRPVDLSKAKIEGIKEGERYSTLENLDIDNCRNVCDAERENSRDDERSNEPADPLG